MNVIRDKAVTIRKEHRCIYCLRKFPSGTQMQYQVNDYDGFQGLYYCLTCSSLISEFTEKFFDDFENVFHEACVFEPCHEKGITPEEFLHHLRLENRNRVSKTETKN